MGVNFKCDSCGDLIEEADAWVLPPDRRPEGIEVLCQDPADPKKLCKGKVLFGEGNYDKLRTALLDRFATQDNALFIECLEASIVQQPKEIVKEDK